MLKLSSLCFSYTPKVPILHEIDLTLRAGELLSVMGPSGCGKSTLLGLIAGSLTPTLGKIETSFERIAYVFQEPRLFPWLTVRENIAAVLPKGTDRSVIDRSLELVELTDAADKLPNELSGGMKIRASLARGLAFGGDLLLLDEPFSALNEELRLELLHKLKAHLKGTDTAAILVTHQKEDALAFSDKPPLILPKLQGVAPSDKL